MEQIESRIHRDFKLTIEQDGEKVRATIELVPMSGDRRLGKVVDALYRRARLLPAGAGDGR